MPEEVDAQDGLSPRELAMVRDPYAYHRPGRAAQAQCAETRAAFRQLARYVAANIVDCRCRSIALTNLEQAAQWAVKAVVFTDPEAVEVPE